jgi:hypothetical protein
MTTKLILTDAERPLWADTRNVVLREALGNKDVRDSIAVTSDPFRPVIDAVNGFCDGLADAAIVALRERCAKESPNAK